MLFRSVAPHGDGVLIKFKGYDSPESAKALSGGEIWVPRDKAAPLAEGEYYFADLVGCELVSGGMTLGRVAGVCETGGGQLLEAELPDGRHAYVPFRKEFTGAIDLAARTIEILAPWVLE